MPVRAPLVRRSFSYCIITFVALFVRPQTYLEMAIAAIKAIKDRTGSSIPAITKYIVANNKLDFKKHLLSSALKSGVKSGMLVMVKASYKLGEKVRL